MFDLILGAILAIVTWCVAGEGVWGAALVCFSVLFGGFIAMNGFEPVAELLSRGGAWDNYWDFALIPKLRLVSEGEGGDLALANCRTCASCHTWHR